MCGTKAAITAGHGDYARDMTANITAYYEKFYGTEFPLTKLGQYNNHPKITKPALKQPKLLGFFILFLSCNPPDSVACPDFSAGAMENWGLILYRETALLYDDAKDTYATKERVNTVVAHELAHQVSQYCSSS